MIGTDWLLPNREHWVHDAACRNVDPEIFFVDPRSRALEDAKAVCRDCPVIESCGEFALRTDQRFGVFGGLSETERAKGRRTGAAGRSGGLSEGREHAAYIRDQRARARRRG